MDLEDKKYIKDGILGCDEFEEELSEETDNLKEAFEPWKADAWLNGTRKENVNRMSPETLKAYANYLDNVGYQALRNLQRPKAMGCVNLMTELYRSANGRGYYSTGDEINRAINSLRNEIDNSRRVRELNNQEPARGGLFNPIPVDEDLNEEVEIHNTLNPLIWNDDETLKPEVKEKIKEIVQIFVDILTEGKVKIKVKDIYIVGSNANYNYNESSDLDVHIIADESSDCDQKHLPLLYNAYKTLFNKKYDISFNGVNVELYVEKEGDLSNASTAIYSLTKGWIKKPDINNIPEIDQEAVGQGLTEWTQKYEELKTNPTIEKIDDYITKLYELRINSIAKEGEFSTGNLIFKEVRRNGILDELKDLKTELEAKQMSLESLKEKLLVAIRKNKKQGN